MALTRKMLKAMGIEEEKIEQIIEAHSETVEALKEERDELREKASSYAEVAKERDELKKAASDANKDSYKVKYEAVKEDFENYKREISEKETKATKETAYRKLLKDAGVSEKRIDAIIKISDTSTIEFDKDGGVKNAAELNKAIKEEWSEFIVSTSDKGAVTANPPANNGGREAKTKEQILAIKDVAERQKAIFENPEAFGVKTF